jgi:chromate transporter
LIGTRGDGLQYCVWRGPERTVRPETAPTESRAGPLGQAQPEEFDPAMPDPEAVVSSPIPAPSDQPAASAAQRHVPTAPELFLAFAQIAALGFGGVLAWARRILVQDRGWLDAEEFNEQLALCQVLPGGNILNFSIMFGSRCAGVLGSLAAMLGLIGPPMVLMIGAGTLYRHYGELPALRGVFASLGAAAAGLLIATAVQMTRATIKDRLRPAHVVAAVTFVAAGVLRLPLIWVMAALIPVSVALAWWERR